MRFVLKIQPGRTIPCKKNDDPDNTSDCPVQQTLLGCKIAKPTGVQTDDNFGRLTMTTCLRTGQSGFSMDSKHFQQVCPVPLQKAKMHARSVQFETPTCAVPNEHRSCERKILTVEKLLSGGK